MNEYDITTKYNEDHIVLKEVYIPYVYQQCVINSEGRFVVYVFP